MMRLISRSAAECSVMQQIIPFARTKSTERSGMKPRSAAEAALASTTPRRSPSFRSSASIALGSGSAA